MIDLEVSDAFIDGPLEKRRDVVASIEGRLRLVGDDQVIFDERSFPIVELAVAMSGWQRTVGCCRPDFEFDSMSAEEAGLLWIRSSTEGWRVGSLWQDRPCVEEMALASVDRLIRRYVEAVRVHVADLAGARAAEWLDELLPKGESCCGD